MTRKIDSFYKRYEKKMWMFLGIIVVVCFFLFWFPHWEAAKFGITDPKDLADAENSRRATSAQILGGVAVGIGLYYTWRRVTIAEKDLKVSQEGQITERFTRAVEQLGAIDHLGKPAIEIRLGGMYALERISKESEKDYWPIMEILSAYVRKNSRILDESEESEFIDEYIDEMKREIFDIQAIITIIRRSKSSFNAEESNYLDLQRTDLRKSNFREADLRGANFEEANLPRANLQEANLRDAKLFKTNFNMANLGQANLCRANLEQAKFYKANLEEVDLRGANFEEANLEKANLRGANLKEAKNLTIYQLSRVKTLYDAKLDNELRISLETEYPELLKVPKTISKLNPE